MAALPGSTTVFTIRGPVERADLPGLCERLRTSLSHARIDTALCHVDRFVTADLVTVDALARMQLAARRVGCAIRLGDVPEDLRELMAYVGLEQAVPRGELQLEPRRQAEQGEELLGVEEERELDDPAA